MRAGGMERQREGDWGRAGILLQDKIMGGHTDIGYVSKY